MAANWARDFSEALSSCRREIIEDVTDLVGVLRRVLLYNRLDQSPQNIFLYLWAPTPSGVCHLSENSPLTSAQLRFRLQPASYQGCVFLSFRECAQVCACLTEAAAALALFVDRAFPIVDRRPVPVHLRTGHYYRQTRSPRALGVLQPARRAGAQMGRPPGLSLASEKHAP